MVDKSLVKSIDGFPGGVIMIGTQIMINVGSRSPEWVNNLTKSDSGTRLLFRILMKLALRSELIQHGPMLGVEK